MESDELGTGQQYAPQPWRHIATRCRARPGVVIETGERSAHKGIASNEKADEWTKMEADKPDTRRVEWQC